MHVVIDISEDDYRKVQDGRASVSMMRKAIRNGTPLPNSIFGLPGWLPQYEGEWVADKKEKENE